MIDDAKTDETIEPCAPHPWMKHVDWRVVCERAQNRVWYFGCISVWFVGLYILRFSFAPTLAEVSLGSTWVERWSGSIWFLASAIWIASGPFAGTLAQRLLIFGLPDERCLRSSSSDDQSPEEDEATRRSLVLERDFPNCDWKD